MSMGGNSYNALPTVEKLQDKMHSLLCYYNTQHKVKSSRKQTGQGADAVYKPQRQFYDSVAFLEEMVTPRRKVSNMDTLSELRSDSLPGGDFPAHEKKLSKKKALPSAIEEAMMAASSVLKVV